MRLASALTTLALSCISPLQAGDSPWVQIAQLYGSDTDAQDSFGERIALDGDTLVVGAFRKDSERGAAYIFERLPDAPTRWVETKALNPTPGDRWMGIWVEVFGDVVAVISSEGGEVGMTNVFQRDAGGPGQWGQVARFGSEVHGKGLHEMGAAIVLDGDLDHDVDGKEDAGGVHVFARGPGGPADWRYRTTLTASDAEAQDHFGRAIALSGDHLLVGAPWVRDLGTRAGAAYVFERDEAGAWSEVIKLLRPDGDEHDNFGNALDLEGETALIAGNADAGDEAAFVYERETGGEWLHVAEFRPADVEGSISYGVSAGVSGDVAVVGAPAYGEPGMLGLGAAFVHERHHGGTDAWGQVAMVLAAEPAELDLFGEYLAIDGNTLAVGVDEDDDLGFDAGTVYLFSRTEPLLSITGTCPGRLAVSVIGTTPVGQVVLLGADEEGTTPIPSGPCAGTEVDLAAPRVVFAGTATSGGDLALAPEVGGGTCGRLVQAVDVGTCATSAVVEIR